ncbi:MAG: spore cortex biosynthesis protein YabQ [Bacillota bacterium]|nr:spore cortex biosynthesis protein YabQ [Bacillota bacterium]MDP4169017.1 spore cortex biosynthesis protein YabQ [Bacillota bacterium]
MTLSTQFITLLSMIGMGALFGVMLDTYQRFLQRPKRRSWIVFFNDLLFWAIQALCVFYVLFQVNQGDLRFYIFLALICGFAAYQSLLKGIYLKILEMLITAIVWIYRFVLRTFQLLIYKPVVMTIQLLIAIILMLGKGLFTLVKFIVKTLLLIIKVFLIPIEKILSFFWKLLPKRIKKTVEKLYNVLAGSFKKIKNFVNRWLMRWNKKK